MTSPQTLVLIGSGPMIGVSSASLFATRKFSNIALISRDLTRLAQDRDSVLSAARAAGKNVNVRIFATDIKNTPVFEKVLKEVEKMGHILIVVFNAARVGPSEMFKFPEEEIVEDFKVCHFPSLPLTIIATNGL
jgi:short-subunit dehydrogenase